MNNKIIIFLLSLSLLCCPYTAAAALDESSDIPVEAHLHRFMARHEVDPSKFNKLDLAVSIRYIFDKSCKEGNLGRMAAIIRFLVNENVLPEELVDFRSQLFSRVSLNKLGHSHINSAFKLR